MNTEEESVDIPAAADEGEDKPRRSKREVKKFKHIRQWDGDKVEENTRFRNGDEKQKKLNKRHTEETERTEETGGGEVST